MTHLSPCYQRAWLRLEDALSTRTELEPFSLEHGQGVFDYYLEHQEAGQLGLNSIPFAFPLSRRVFDDLMAGLSEAPKWPLKASWKADAEAIVSLPLWRELQVDLTQDFDVVDLGGGRGVLVEALNHRWGLRGTVLEREGADLFSEGICPEFPTAQARRVFL